MSKRYSLDEILEGFNPSAAPHARGTTLTIWVPIEVKSRYKKLQDASGRTFSKTLTELVRAAIEIAEGRES